jgi:hypothetical protein
VGITAVAEAVAATTEEDGADEVEAEEVTVVTRPGRFPGRELLKNGNGRRRRTY